MALTQDTKEENWLVLMLDQNEKPSSKTLILGAKTYIKMKILLKFGLVTPPYTINPILGGGVYVCWLGGGAKLP